MRNKFTGWFRLATVLSLFWLLASGAYIGWKLYSSGNSFAAAISYQSPEGLRIIGEESMFVQCSVVERRPSCSLKSLNAIGLIVVPVAGLWVWCLLMFWSVAWVWAGFTQRPSLLHQGADLKGILWTAIAVTVTIAATLISALLMHPASALGFFVGRALTPEFFVPATLAVFAARSSKSVLLGALTCAILEAALLPPGIGLKFSLPLALVFNLASFAVVFWIALGFRHLRAAAKGDSNLNGQTGTPSAPVREVD
jgi:hypothetical protein